MRAVTFQAPGEVRVDERPEPEPVDARRRDRAGRGERHLRLRPPHLPRAGENRAGFIIGHEYVGTVIAAGDGVTGVSVGDRVLGTYGTACGGCFHCRRSEYHKCESARVFGHGATLGSLDGTQAEQALVPTANLTLRKVPESVSDDAALFAGDVAGTAYHAIHGDAVGGRPLEPARPLPSSASARSASARSRSQRPRAPPR